MSLFDKFSKNTKDNISIKEAKELLSQSPSDYFFMDVRTPEEFKLRHAEGFTNIPLDDLEKKLPELPKDKPLVVICLSGARSSAACKFLRSKDFNQVMNVTGGMASWK